MSQKAIGDIYLIWRKDRGDNRIAIGVIKRNQTDGIRFKYIPEGLKKAKAEGFGGYAGFPEVEKEYKENVIEKFGQRLIRTERNDLSDFYTFWKINSKYKNDDYYMLAFTQGILATDNYEFLADFNPKKGLSFISEIAGLSKTKISSDIVQVGDILTYSKDPTNDYDKRAVALYKGDKKLGYVKRIHNRVFYKTKGEIEIKVHHLEKNGKIDRAFISINFL